MLSANQAYTISRMKVCALNPAPEAETLGTTWWLPYEQPQNRIDILECEEVDLKNQRIWNETNAQLCAGVRKIWKTINPTGQMPDQLGPPVMYCARNKDVVNAHAKSDASYAQIAAMHYLFHELHWLPFEFYDPAEATRLANDHSEQKLIDEARADGTILLQKHDGCMCDRKWSGRIGDDSCIGHLHPIWARHPNHSFLSPRLPNIEFSAFTFDKTK